MTSWMRRRLREQAGFTIVEMIVTVAVGGLVMAAVFPIFLLVNRVERTFSGNAQARAVGLLAEQAFEQDLRTYAVVETGPQTLVLQGAPNPANPDPASTFCISYAVTGDSSEPRLVRVSSLQERELSRSTVAHGVSSFETSLVPRSSAIKVSLQLTSAAGTGLSVSITPDPPLMITPRFDTTPQTRIC